MRLEYLENFMAENSAMISVSDEFRSAHLLRSYLHELIERVTK